MKRKETLQQIAETVSNDPTTPPPQLEIGEVLPITNPVKRYKSENFGQTFDSQSYTETLDLYKPVRCLTENSNLTKRREERETLFQESSILINRFQHSLDDSSGTPSFNTQNSNSSADTDPRVRRERELAFIRGREPDFELNGRYDPANAENLPKIRTEVKDSIELDVDDEIYRPRGNSDHTTESGETKLGSSNSDQGSVASQEDDFSIGAAVTIESSTITTKTTTTTTTKATTTTTSTSSVITDSLTATLSDKADSSVADSNTSESDDNTN